VAPALVHLIGRHDDPGECRARRGRPGGDQRDPDTVCARSVHCRIRRRGSALVGDADEQSRPLRIESGLECLRRDDGVGFRWEAGAPRGIAQDLDHAQGGVLARAAARDDDRLAG
jgi:hypothetical protein